MAHKAVSIRELHTRLSNIMRHHEEDGHPERADMPLYIRMARGKDDKGNPWFLPLEGVDGTENRLNISLPNVRFTVLEVSESRATKLGARRS